jgi:hypothetical protein
MTEKILVICAAAICIGFGLAKAIWPQFFLELRRRHPWFDLLDIYSFIFKSNYAEQTVRINGYVLLVIGFGLLAWLIFK